MEACQFHLRPVSEVYCVGCQQVFTAKLVGAQNFPRGTFEVGAVAMIDSAGTVCRRPRKTFTGES